ncbi:MAG: YdcF family protein [Clostridia bacterium]|nr:YdcF family protein [Clostridia bacterium]
MHAAKVWQAGWAPYVIPSGRYSKVAGCFAGVRADVRAIYSGDYDTEWDFLRDVLRREGVPDSAILKENEATYTWENALMTRALTDRMGLNVRRAILCCKPFHARRALLYYQAAFPDTEILVSPCPWPGCDRDDWHRTRAGQDMVLGEVRRLGDQVNEVFAQMTGV